MSIFGIFHIKSNGNYIITQQLSSLLMLQVASLKDTISKKDEEIERLHLFKDLKNEYPGGVADKTSPNLPRYGSL